MVDESGGTLEVARRFGGIVADGAVKEDDDEAVAVDAEAGVEFTDVALVAGAEVGCVCDVFQLFTPNGSENGFFIPRRFNELFGATKEGVESTFWMNCTGHLRFMVITPF